MTDEKEINPWIKRAGGSAPTQLSSNHCVYFLRTVGLKLSPNKRMRGRTGEGYRGGNSGECVRGTDLPKIPANQASQVELCLAQICLKFPKPCISIHGHRLSLLLINNDLPCRYFIHEDKPKMQFHQR